jgi:hypothetical protein
MKILLPEFAEQLSVDVPANALAQALSWCVRESPNRLM